MTTDQSLADAVIIMQRRDLVPETRQVVDEAARLLGEGREMEARALLEKAEALVAQENIWNQDSENSYGIPKSNGASGLAAQGLIAPLAAKLAAGFTSVLTHVLEDVHRYTGDQVQSVANALQQHLHHMESELRRAAGIGERLEQLVNEHQTGLQLVRQGQEELWNAVRALQHAGQEQHASVARVSSVAEELTHQVASYADAVTCRFVALEERVSVIDRITQEIPSQLADVVARLDRNTETLQVLEQRQMQRVSTLNQVLDTLAKLKENDTPELAAACGQ